MNLFGGKFCWKEDGDPCTCSEMKAPGLCECDRANFNTLLWALVTVFQVILFLEMGLVLFHFSTSERKCISFIICDLPVIFI